MTLTELGSPSELQSFLQDNNVCLVTFSAHWCGPCKQSKPQLEALAKEYSSPVVPFGYTYESDLGEFLHTFQIKAFPTYAMFVAGKEVQRVEGVNFSGIQEMVTAHANASEGATTEAAQAGGGTALGGGGAAPSPEEARRSRLAKLDGPPAPAPAPEEQTPKPMDTEEPSPTKKMEDADADATMEEAVITSTNPVDHMDPEVLKTLTESMGFSLLRAQKGLLYSSGATVETAVEWLMEHQDDVDIDEPIPEGAVAKAQSYKCNECGMLLSNMANLELHANKTGHSDFEESTQSVTPLTAEEKEAKMGQIKDLLKAKRAEREEEEKVDNVAREIARRSMGKEMAKTQEQMDAEQRKRDTRERKREKEDSKKERLRIRAELEKDKRERIANKGKLKGRLGVDGYNPDAIQYDKVDGTEEPAAQKPKKAHADIAQVDEYIKKVSSYRAGGDGGKCLKILKAYVGNAADNPGDEKFKNINMENKAFKTRIKPFIGAKLLLLAVGFSPKEGDATHLTLKDDADPQALKDTKEKLEKAFATF
jgi:thiol-disulfide isomerase/thioredoxin